MYTFTEILALFKLEDVSTIREEDMKQAKMIVLRMHPDKSRLNPNYFVFYKKAYEILYKYYQSQTKVESQVPTTKIVYDPYRMEGGVVAANQEEIGQVKTVLDEMKPKKFQQRFNELYEENMVDKEAKQRAQDRNKWFTQEDAIYSVDTKGVTKDNIGQKMGSLRNETALEKYRGVQTLSSFGGGIVAERLWEDGEDEEGAGAAAAAGSYITTDPFSKLKFDDLRRVHRDETVFVVDERQYDKMPKYESVDKYNRARDAVDLTPMNDLESQRLLKEQEDLLKARQARYQKEAIMRSQAFEEKNKNVLANFLRLGN
jgi:hypothetical protein